MDTNHGFTLIELMVAIVIVGILAGISVPVYQSYARRSADHACLAEAASYARLAFTDLIDGHLPRVPENSACAAISTATATNMNVTATVRSPGLGTVVCEMENASCRFL